MSSPEHILCIGSGNFGTALTIQLSKNKNKVTMFARDLKLVQSINQHHVNYKYLQHYPLDKELVSAVNEFSEQLFASHKFILFTLPTQHLRNVLEEVKPFLNPQFHVLIFANKGIEISTLDLPCHIVSHLLGEEFLQQNSVFFSGPSFALEICQDQLTAVVVTSLSPQSNKLVQTLFHSKTFRVYLSNDIIGVEVAGALKNCFAICSGICTGLGYQLNPRAALLTRGLNEIMKVGLKMGAKVETFIGLSGVGDLMLTCTSEKSRNFTVGHKLGQQKQSLEEILEHLGSVAEGVTTTKAAYELVKKLQVNTPIINCLYRILYENVPIGAAIEELLEEEVAEEFIHVNGSQRKIGSDERGCIHRKSNESSLFGSNDS